jgi:hypothetical protein
MTQKPSLLSGDDLEKMLNEPLLAPREERGYSDEKSNPEANENVPTNQHRLSQWMNTKRCHQWKLMYLLVMFLVVMSLISMMLATKRLNQIPDLRLSSLVDHSLSEAAAINASEKKSGQRKQERPQKCSQASIHFLNKTKTTLLLGPSDYGLSNRDTNRFIEYNQYQLPNPHSPCQEPAGWFSKPPQLVNAVVSYIIPLNSGRYIFALHLDKDSCPLEPGVNLEIFRGNYCDLSYESTAFVDCKSKNWCPSGSHYESKLKVTLKAGILYTIIASRSAGLKLQGLLFNPESSVEIAEDPGFICGG